MSTVQRTLVALLLTAGCGSQLVEFGGTKNSNNPPPTVISTIPANAATGVPINQKISATFNTAMDPTTITATTFTVKQGSTAVAGTVSYAGTTATFAPTANLAANTTFGATITAGVKDLAGIAMAADYNWSFTTSATVDTTPPTVTSTNPANLATNVALNTKVTAVFSKPMDPLAITGATFTLTQGTTPVPGAVTYAGVNATATFTPQSNLAASTKYTGTVTTGAKDLAGNALAANYTWSFTTGATVGPAVVFVDPANNATNVALNKQVSAVFDEAMDPTTINTITFTLKQGTVTIAGAVSYLGNTATFAPTSPLAASTTYTATVTAGAKDPAGIALAADFPWSFMTGAAVPPPLAINLGRAASYGLASRAGLTSTGVTVVNGDVALYPTATCSDATGNAGAGQSCLFKTYTSPTGMTVNGSIFFAGDPFDNGQTANAVTNDLNSAWVEGKNKVPTQPTIAGNELSSPIAYVPGVYHNPTLGLMGGGIATLDAANDANAVWIFQDDASFVDSGTTLNPSKIVLINGAQARNVWFIIGSAFTTGSGTTWNGNVLAGGTVTINHDCTVLGRVLGGAAGAGAVTLTGAASPSLTKVTVP